MAIVEQVDPGVEHVSPPRARRGRALLAAALLLAVYGVLSVANDPHGYLGTDTGGKVLTLQAMEDRGSTTNLDVGYWAEEHDPEGRLHPYFGTGRIGVRWIQVTTVPLLLAASPLYDLGGYRLALLLPMLGGVLVAAAARALAQRFGADRAQAWWAFWLVGLAGPVVVYALDLWEHTLGLAAMAWAVVLLADARRSPVVGAASRCAAGAGLLWGIGFSMRTESLLYGATTTAAVLVAVVVADRRLPRVLAMGAASALGVAVAVLANRALEDQVLGGSLRAGRAGGAAGGAGAGLPQRLEEGLVTTIGLVSGAGPLELVLGAIGIVALGLVVFAGTRPEDDLLRSRLPLLAVVGSIPFVFIVLEGLDFVPSIFVASPFAIVGVVAGRNERTAPFWWAALGSLPVVWLFQYVGGADPQWGARYALLSAFVLVVAGVVALPPLGSFVQRTFLALAVGITAYGLVWVAVRTHGAADAGRQLAGRPEPVLIAAGETGFVPREFVADASVKRWLAADDRDELDDAVQIVADVGYREFGIVELGGHRSDRSIAGFALVGVHPVPFLPGAPLQVASYRAR